MVMVSPQCPHARRLSTQTGAPPRCQVVPFKSLDWTTGSVDCTPAVKPEVTYWGTFDGTCLFPPHHNHYPQALE
jgi:hypothetical protein